MHRKRNILCVAIAAVLLVSGTSYGQKKQPASQSRRVTITLMGFEPAALRLKRGIPAKITLLRTTNETCATEVVFPDFGIDRRLPLNQAVTISLTPTRAGEFNFTCGMNMHRGKLIIQ